MITDNFPYGDGALSGQAAWATVSYQGSLTVSSNTIVGTNLESRANLRTDSWNANHSSQLTVTGGNDTYPGVICSGSDSGSGLNGYLFGIVISSGGASGQWFLEPVTNGATGAALDSGDTAGSVTFPFSLKVAREGNDIVAYINGAEVGRGTNTTFPAGKPGVFGFQGGSNVVMDAWVGTGEIVASAAVDVEHAQAVFQGQSIPLRYTAPLIAAQAVFQGQNVGAAAGGGSIGTVVFAQATFEPQTIMFLFGSPRDPAEAVFEGQDVNFALRYKFFFADCAFEGQTVGVNALIGVRADVVAASAVFAGSNINLVSTGTVNLNDMVQDDRTILRPMAFDIADTDR